MKNNAKIIRKRSKKNESRFFNKPASLDARKEAVLSAACWIWFEKPALCKPAGSAWRNHASTRARKCALGSSSVVCKAAAASSPTRAVLALINFVNFPDRQVIVPLVPLLRDQLGVTDAQLGSLQTWLLVVLAVASIPFGFFADRFSQTRIIARGVVFWSLATIVSGLAPSFSILLVARALVGVGEAAYAPAAQSMISGAFPQERRARAQAIFAAGMLLGGASGLALGGIMGESSGWQHVFFLVGLVGLVPGLSVLKLKEPPRAPRSEVVPIGRLLRVPAFLAMIAAGMFITFSSVSLLAWSIDFAVNYKEFSLRQASYELAAIALFSLVFGVLTGGYIADRLQKRFAYGRLIAIAGAFLLAAPFVLLAIQTERKWVVVTALFRAGSFMFWYRAPDTAA